MQPLSVKDVAKLLRMGKREAREYLRQLSEQHREEHGELLYRTTTALNGKLWVDVAVLAKIQPDKFGELADLANVVDIHHRIDVVEESLEELRNEVRAIERRIR